MRIAATILAGMLVAACAGPNSSLNTLQFSDETVPFPKNYQVEAARVVRDRSGDPASVLVSYPRPIIGATMIGPQRWYVCLRGVPAPAPSASPPMAAELAAQWLFQQRPENRRFDVVLIFSRDSGRPSIKTGLDSPLCNDGAFEPLTAAPPVI